MDRNGRRFQKQITQVCQNAVKEQKWCTFPRVYNYSGLPDPIISELVRKRSSHLSYDLANVKGCGEHDWKASPKVRETPGY